MKFIGLEVSFFILSTLSALWNAGEWFSNILLLLTENFFDFSTSEYRPW